jgi:endonuclease/exonuclease/phosphatase family metal-dependent hydrolase
MIALWAATFRRLRWRLSLNELVLSWLRLPRFDDGGSVPGLILVQIDGLSRRQLEKALRRGRMPFVRRLIQREKHRLHTLYSGIPSTTPAVQAELFYGVRQVVPAFSFRDPETKSLVRMLDSEPAAKIERYLAQNGQSPLLAGGSAYADIYSGDAAESHFCPATMGSERSPSQRQRAMLLLLLGHLPSVFRMVMLAIVELFLALQDCARGVFAGRELGKELKFILNRIAVSVVLRDLVVIGARADATRGVPVIHVNLLGYDEQAHRRGPGSAFAHWSLRGIDNAIRRIWQTAAASPRRDYDVWIYSDHGQQRTIPYQHVEKRTIVDAVNETVRQQVGGIVRSTRISGSPERDNPHRSHWLYARQSKPWMEEHSAEAAGGTLEVAAMGPLGHVYLDTPLDEATRDRLAEALVRDAGIPLVMAKDGPGCALAWTSGGKFSLPADGALILGARHPFLPDVADDLAALCHHRLAGDFVISGWRLDGPPLSFPVERGAHAGPGPEETRAFALLPPDVRFTTPRRWLRADELRQAALEFLGRVPVSIRPRRTPGNQFRVVTYNVHSCLGMDHKRSTERIARVLAQCNADVIALQELDVRRRRSDGIDQAHRIAELLQMEHHFHPALSIEEERYGDAILSRFPMRLVRAAALPGNPGKPTAEPRGALWVTVEMNGQALHIVNTHLGLNYRERMAQINALLGPQWLGNCDSAESLLFCGDFNAQALWPNYRRIADRLQDVQVALKAHRPLNTWPAHFPVMRIDHVFMRGPLEVVAVEVPRTNLARLASDHLPLVVEMRLR